MESVLAAFVVIFLILFGALTLADSFLAAQDSVHTAWQEMEARSGQQASTDLLPIAVRISSGGSMAEFILRNAGSTRLADFAHWDMIVRYNDDTDPTRQHVAWLPYLEGLPVNNEWTVSAIFLDAAAGTVEASEPGVFNPGEELVVQVQVSPPVGLGQPLEIALASPEGVAVTLAYLRNIPPLLAINAGIEVPTLGTAVVGETVLQATDEDDLPADLVYTVLTLPGQGTLSIADHFTQQDIHDGLLTYTHNGSGDDSFTFAISDGEDEVGPFSFALTVSAPPVLVTNAGLPLAEGGTSAIYYTMLDAHDADTPAEELTYIIVQPPGAGTLSRSDTFTQADISAGLLNYIHTGEGNDAFTFALTDGVSVSDLHTFYITVSAPQP